MIINEKEKFSSKLADRISVLEYSLFNCDSLNKVKDDRLDGRDMIIASQQEIISDQTKSINDYKQVTEKKIARKNNAIKILSGIPLITFILGKYLL